MPNDFLRLTGRRKEDEPMDTPELVKVLREKHTMMCLNCGYEHNCSLGRCELMQQAADALERVTAPENKPLTLEELRQMNGDPVWLVTKRFQDWRQYTYSLPKDKLIAFWQFGDEEEDTFDINEYGKSVFAYAHKPEDVAI